ncbi:helix-hairpin-helix domain-containing protein [Capnocytophaga leadbetteri]|uniref:helix-hairpin-helix domain-containing protein n=1 Tax=Capnocytophaga leadbetteri TaxID=327575 RepID=UPI0028D6F94B|nr:helix-hairpin-helix domain-containing protein [Capnocytophaga leadbetteri]
MFFDYQRNRGILALLVLMVVGQLVFYYWPISSSFTEVEDTRLQTELDSLRQLAAHHKDTIYPFNPNFISDYKGFKLGLTTAQLDKLQAFRAADKYVNSAEEFQRVTGISDSLLRRIAPAFRFPEWVKNKRKESEQKATAQHIEKQDINTATQEELMKIYGIGEGFSNRILKYKEKLQGFTYIDQVAEVYGLEKEVYERVAARFEVKTPPVIVKKDLNAISRYDLSKIPYIKYGESNKIIGLRSEVGMFKHLDDLLQIEGFDEARIKRLALYLYVGN